MYELRESPSIAIAPAPPASATPVMFSGVRGDFLRLLMRGALLELVTLGFYRFWLVTDMRRHMWSHTTVGGDALEYTGTAKELLIGFLIALAILVPVYLVYFLIGIAAETWQQFASVPLALFFYVFAQFAFYRARRYQMTRTIWRGVRFWMGGSGWAYAGRATLWAMLSLLTLGLALPWRHAALERYKIRHSHYGDLQGRFDGVGIELFRRVWWVWLVVAALGVILVAAGLTEPRVIPIVLLLGLLAWPTVYSAYKALVWNWWVCGIRFGDVRFESNLSTADLAGLYWKAIGWSALIVTAAVLWIGGVIAAGISLEGAAALQRPVTLGAMALGYVAAALTFGVVVRLYLRRDLWMRIVSTTAVHNLAAAESVAARGQAAHAVGEGLADSLDIGGF